MLLRSRAYYRPHFSLVEVTRGEGKQVSGILIGSQKLEVGSEAMSVDFTLRRSLPPDDRE